MEKVLIRNDRFLFCVILVIWLCYLSSCGSNKRIYNKHNNLSQSISNIWMRDSCGFTIGDRAAVANIYNDYINSQWPRPKIKEIKNVLGTPNEIRDYSDNKVHWYFYIGVKNCVGEVDGSSFVLDVVYKKNKKKVLGSSIYLWEPEDN
jgi:hypothetical protein